MTLTEAIVLIGAHRNTTRTPPIAVVRRTT
jgi:hypothetical protein